MWNLHHGRCEGFSIILRRGGANPVRSSVLRFVMVGALAAGVAGLAMGGCAEKKKGYLADTSEVIPARQRAYGFVFKVKSPGSALDNQGLHQFVDSQKSGFKTLYQPKKLDDFGV